MKNNTSKTLSLFYRIKFILLRGILLLGIIVNINQLNAQPLAFPSAEGGGKFTTGGRGGKVITVTNLNDSGEGSLRNAIEQKGARIVVFAVDGTIQLQSKLIIENDSITIAGQTAPGDGICLKGYPFYIRANNVIVRYIRSRIGDESGASDDAIGGMRIKDLIIDHCSASWSVDECLTVYRAENVTVQWCMITHSLSKSVHKKGAHGFGGIWGGANSTYHHNLIAHHSSRNPRFASDGGTPVDFRNNVVYNWGYKSAYGGGQGGKINFIANYYKPGPATVEEKKACFLDPADDETGSYFLADNIMGGNSAVTENNWLGVTSKKSFTKATEPFECISIQQDKPEIAYIRVLLNAGCSYKRDSYDKMVVNEIVSGTSHGGETFGGGNKGIIDNPSAVGGWPELKQGIYPKDSDGDGMPDKWEIENGLDPNKDDSYLYSLNNEYTNIEVYINSLTD